MNTTNPFRIPACLQRVTREQQRRERFRRVVVFTIGATVSLLLALLIEGCVAEHSHPVNSPGTPAAGQHGTGPESQPVSHLSQLLPPTKTL